MSEAIAPNANSQHWSNVASSSPVSRSLIDWIIVFGLQIVCFAPARLIQFAGGVINISDIVMVCIAALILARRMTTVNGMRWPIGFLFVGSLWGFGAVTHFFNDGDWAQFLVGIKLILAAVLFPCLIAWGAAGDRRLLDLLLWSSLLGAVFLSLISVTSQFGVPFLGLFDEAAAAGHRATGLTYHSNILGYLAAINIPIAGYLFYTSGNKIIRLALLACILVMLDAILLSKSRTSLLAVITALLPFALILLRPSRTPMPAIVLLSVFALGALLLAFLILAPDLFPAELIQKMGRFLGLDYSTTVSDYGRMLLAQIALREFFDAPILGVGFEDIRFAHNHFLSMLHCAGIVGLAAFLLWLWVNLSGYYRLYVITSGELVTERLPILYVLVSGVLIWFVFNAFQPVLTERNGYITIGIMWSFLLYPRKNMFNSAG